MDFDLTAALPVLERTPHALRALLAGLPPAWTAATEGPETWSPYDVVGHLLHGEQRAQHVRRALQHREGGRRVEVHRGSCHVPTSGAPAATARG